MAEKNVVTVSSSGFDMFCEKIFKELDLDKQISIINKYLTVEIKKVLDDTVLLESIEAFFANNLNIAETSRIEFIHRNTLIYRLDKIHKLTGLDLRNFEDAVSFRLYMWLNKKGKRANGH